MSNISYPSKAVSGSGTAVYQEGNTLPAGELQGDFDAVASVVNGQLDEDNLKAGTQIPSSKLAEVDPDNVGDSAGTASAYLTNTSPGDTLELLDTGAGLPTNLTEEHARTRYVIRVNGRYASNAQATDSTGTLQNVGWVEPPLNGPNLLPNDGFEAQSGAANSAPDGWTLSGTPSTVAIEDPATTSAGSEKRSLNIKTAATNDGIEYVVKGLRSSHKYLFGIAYTRTVGEVAIATDGGIAGGNDYSDFVITDDASTAYIVRQGIVLSDASGSDITAKIYGVTIGAEANDFNVHAVWFYELSIGSPRNVPHIPSQVATHSTEEVLPSTFTTDTFNWENVNELNLSQYIPSVGYRLVYEVTLCYTGAAGVGAGGSYASASGTYQQFGFRVRMDDGSGIGIVDGPYIEHSTDNGANNISKGGVLTMKHIVENPEPGLTYAFTTDVGAFNLSGGTADEQMALSPLGGLGLDAVQGVSKARLMIERV